MNTRKELWSAARIAEEFGWSGGSATARRWISRCGITHVATEGPRDTRLYDPEAVRNARATQRGHGWRKGLTKDSPPPDTSTTP